MSNKKVEERHVLQKAVGDQSERGRDDPEHSGRQGRPQDPERILEVLREITDHGPRQASNHAEEHPPEGHFFFPSPSEQTDRNDHSGAHTTMERTSALREGTLPLTGAKASRR